jgi:hypothetical protein
METTIRQETNQADFRHVALIRGVAKHLVDEIVRQFDNTPHSIRLIAFQSHESAVSENLLEIIIILLPATVPATNLALIDDMRPVVVVGDLS